MNFLLRCLLLAILGVLHAWSVALPFDVGSFLHRGDTLWAMQIACLVGLYGVLATARRQHVGWLAFVFAWVWLIETVWWLYTSMHVYGGLAAWMTVLAIMALCGFLAAYFGVLFALWARLFVSPNAVCMQTSKPWAAAVGFTACWVLAELARHHVFTGFPWGAAGHAHLTGPLHHFAPYVGVYGVAGVAAVLAATLAHGGLSLWFAWVKKEPFKKQPLVSVACLVVVVGLMAWGLSAHTQRMLLQAKASNTAPHVQVRLLQGNIPQGEKFDTETGVPQALEWYRQQWQQTTASLTISPETSIPLLPYELPEDYLLNLGKRFGDGKQAALAGIPLGDFDGGYTNSVIAIAKQHNVSQHSKIYVYNKQHLVPFGEFIPKYFKWFTELMRIPLGDFDRGDLVQPDFFWQHNYWSPNICYEDLFGDELAARFVKQPNRPLVLVNVSNIAWFGDSVAIDQHLNMSRMRSLELARPMVRATNTGATAFINATGMVESKLHNFSVGFLDGAVRGSTWHTPYAYWAGKWSHWPLFVFLLMLLLLAGVTSHKSQQALWSD